MMSHRNMFRYHYTSGGRSARHDGWVKLSDYDFHDRPERMESLTALTDPEGIWAQDFMRIAKAAYLADRRSVRGLMPDGWTRAIKLVVEVEEPDRWNKQCESDLADLLGMLTGDQWEIRLEGGLSRQPPLLDELWATEVALFSGGLDSTAYAAQRAAHLGTQERVLFIAYDWNLKNPQWQLFSRIKRIAPSSVCLTQTRLNPKAYGKKIDVTNRSRSLLFAATAVCVAAVHRVTRVAIPENGQIALNPALTPARLSACSTRSVHPWTLHLINRIIAGVGGHITVHNPLLGLTKGEVCEQARRAGLSAEVLQYETISCAHPTVARRDGNPDYHCGYCFPCLVRRAGLQTILEGQPDRTGYKFDPVHINPSDEKNPRATDLRDLIYWVTRTFTIYDLIADAPLPPDIAPAALLPVLQRSRNEILSMIAKLPYADRTARPPRLPGRPDQPNPGPAGVPPH